MLTYHFGFNPQLLWNCGPLPQCVLSSGSLSYPLLVAWLTVGACSLCFRVFTLTPKAPWGGCCDLVLAGLRRETWAWKNVPFLLPWETVGLLFQYDLGPNLFALLVLSDHFLSEHRLVRSEQRIKRCTLHNEFCCFYQQSRCQWPSFTGTMLAPPC